MSENVKLVPRCDDEQVLKLFSRLSDELGFSSLTFHMYGSDLQSAAEARQKLINELKNEKGYLIRHANAHRKPDQPHHTQQLFSLTFERGQRLPNGTQQPSLHTDSIIFSQSNTLEPETAHAINKII